MNFIYNMPIIIDKSGSLKNSINSINSTILKMMISFLLFLLIASPNESELSTPFSTSFHSAFMKQKKIEDETSCMNYSVKWCLEDGVTSFTSNKTRDRDGLGEVQLGVIRCTGDFIYDFIYDSVINKDQSFMYMKSNAFP